MATLPPVDELFADPSLSPAEKSTLRDEYLAKLDAAPTITLDRNTPMPHQSGRGIDFTSPRTASAVLERVVSGELNKSLSADALASLTTALDGLKAQIPDLTKDISLTSPVSAGLVAYDLEAPAKMLTPKPTPIRNRLPRRRGVGLNHQFKRITGFTGTGTGGVGITRAGITDATQTNFANPSSSNNLFYNRGPKIAYAGDTQTIPYIQFSLSDETSWSTQYSGIGYQDIRALSRNSVLWSSMLVEERTLLYGRGTAAGFSGILAAPTVGTNAARSAAAGEVGITNGSANAYVRIVAEMGDFGVSQATAASAAIAFTTGQVIDVGYTLPAGATGARVFISLAAGADPGDGSRFLYTTTAGTIFNGRSGWNTLTIQGTIQTSGTTVTAYPLTGGGTANLTAADGGSAVATEYDGILAYCTGSSAGYTTKINGAFSTTNPGVEYQTAFASLWDAVKADPDRILMAGRDRKQLSDTIKGSSNSNYGIRLMQDDINGVTLGSVAVAILNEVSGGGEVALEVHPWLPQGNSLIISDTLPIPDSNVDSIFAVYNVQDMMGVDWPVNQFSYDTSTYWYGALICYAPAWCGSVVGIKAA